MNTSFLKTLSIAAAATAFVVAAVAPFATAVQRNVVEPSQALTAALQQCSGIEFTAAQRQCVAAVLANAKGQVDVAVK